MDKDLVKTLNNLGLGDDMKYSIILYDIDGTLFDYEKAEGTAFFSTMNKFFPDQDLLDLKKKYVKFNIELWRKFEDHEISADFLRVERFRNMLALPSLLSFSSKVNPEEISVGKRESAPGSGTILIL